MYNTEIYCDEMILHAIEKGNIETVKRILDYRCKINLPFDIRKYEKYLIRYMIQNYRLDMTHLFFECGEKLNYKLDINRIFSLTYKCNIKCSNDFVFTNKIHILFRSIFDYNDIAHNKKSIKNYDRYLLYLSRHNYSKLDINISKNSFIEMLCNTKRINIYIEQKYVYVVNNNIHKNNNIFCGTDYIIHVINL